MAATKTSAGAHARRAAGAQKKYRNAGVSTLEVDGIDMEPGSEFLASLDPEQEMHWITGGHIEILQDQSAAADRAQAAEADGDTAPERKSRRS
jgi:hypothetical protein